MSKVRKGKTLNCKICNDEVQNCGVDATAVTCWRCVQAMMRGIIQESEDKEENEDKL